MNASDITPSDIAAWYRQQIKKYQRLLSLHEAEFPATSAASPAKGSSHVPIELPKLGKVDAAKIKESISLRGARVGDLATRFNVDASAIKAIIADPANGLSDKDRGWVKLVNSR